MKAPSNQNLKDFPPAMHYQVLYGIQDLRYSRFPNSSMVYTDIRTTFQLVFCKLCKRQSRIF